MNKKLTNIFILAIVVVLSASFIFYFYNKNNPENLFFEQDRPLL